MNIDNIEHLETLIDELKAGVKISGNIIYDLALFASKAKEDMVKNNAIIGNRLWGVFCTYEDEKDELLSVHKGQEGAIKNMNAQTDYSQDYYHTDFVVLWD